MQAARAGALVGFAGTSNVAAAAYGLPAVGTMAHSFIETFGDERQAFRVFARNTLGPLTLLVDTYDTQRGVSIAAEVLSEFPDHRGKGVRLDSGDLRTLSPGICSAAPDGGRRREHVQPDDALRRATAGRDREWQTGRPQQSQHRPVLGEDEGREPGDPTT